MFFVSFAFSHKLKHNICMVFFQDNYLLVNDFNIKQNHSSNPAVTHIQWSKPIRLIRLNYSTS